MLTEIEFVISNYVAGFVSIKHIELLKTNAKLVPGNFSKFHLELISKVRFLLAKFNLLLHSYKLHISEILFLVLQLQLECYQIVHLAAFDKSSLFAEHFKFV